MSQKSNEKKAILTGATGYIGSNLLKSLLNEGWEIAIIVRKSSSFHYIKDVKDLVEIFEYEYDLAKLIELFVRFKPDIVFHLASNVIVEHRPIDVTNLVNSNILFGVHLLEAMKNTETNNFVNTGSFWQHFQNESYNPVNLYAATKESFKAILKYYSEVFEIRTITLELFDTYGPYDRRPKILNLLKKIDDDQSCIQMSPGEQEVNFVYIDDVVRAYLRAAEILFQNETKLINKDYMVKSQETVRLKDLVELYEQVNKTVLDVQWGGRPYRSREVMKVWDNNEMLIGWEAKVPLKEGLFVFKNDNWGEGVD